MSNFYNVTGLDLLTLVSFSVNIQKTSFTCKQSRMFSMGSLMSLLSYQVLSHIDRTGNQNDETLDHILHVHVDGQEVQCYEDDS